MGSNHAKPGAGFSALRYSLLGLQREGNRRLARALAPLGVTPAQAEVIGVLGEFGPATLKRLGELLVCETGSPSRLVEALVRRGLIDRVTNPIDRRQVLLQLTREGRRVRSSIAEVEDAVDRELHEAFGAEFETVIVQRARQFLGASRSGEALKRRFPQ